MPKYVSSSERLGVIGNPMLRRKLRQMQAMLSAKANDVQMLTSYLDVVFRAKHKICRLRSWFTKNKMNHGPIGRNIMHRRRCDMTFMNRKIPQSVLGIKYYWVRLFEFLNCRRSST